MEVVSYVAIEPGDEIVMSCKLSIFSRIGKR